MTNYKILRKAIEKAEKTGYECHVCICKEVMSDYLKNGGFYRELIFDHDFAKAFWGEETEKIYGITGMAHPHLAYFQPKWKYHLQRMVLEEDPILYLEQFLK